ncbi:NADH dehydrogenase [ubiquinone] 1 beta subcomplex subunit 4-like [Antedon mediterranea]|uniref:NADH dehydrogenase [ubiquinone] 1 beta subcomplex subunit 4-like n=1 Tax=Antedon mediterranea TaxID=105859 RepID=UPI003AF681F7
MDAFRGVPAEEKAAELERAALRDVYRREYQRNIQNPSHKGYLLDPAVKRWNYARVNSYMFYRATTKTTLLGIVFGLIPPALIMYYVTTAKTKREAAYKAGTAKPPRNLRL